MPYLLTGNTVGELYPKLLELLLQGTPADPRGQPTHEQLAVTVHLTDLTQNILVHPVRNLNYRFMVAEWLWVMAGREDVATLARYNPKMAEFSDDGKVLAGAYGPRLRKEQDQLLWCARKLMNDPDTRQAVATIWTPCPTPSKDVPCTVSAQFLRRHDTLHGIWTMRSSDAWLGLPYDLFNFSMITSCLAGELDTRPGTLTLQLGSSHLYARDQGRATELLARWAETATVRSPWLPYLPSCRLPYAILEGVPTTEYPRWKPYADVLRCATKAEALEVLRHAAP